MAEKLKAKTTQRNKPEEGALVGLSGLSRMHAWFSGRGWQPFKYQQNCWSQYLSGKSGLVHASTGTGKTYSIWPGPLIEFMSLAAEQSQTLELRGKVMEAPLTVLWITPLRALASDIASSLLAPVKELGLPFSVETRTSDTSSSKKAKQREAAVLSGHYA